MSDQADFLDSEQGKGALLNVRSDSHETQWALFSYENEKSAKLVLVAKGNEGVDEMKENFQDNMVGYGLVRKTEVFDGSTTVKFVYVQWIGKDVPRMQRAKISVHKGAIEKLIGQFHVNLVVEHKEEISDEIVQQKIGETSGTQTRVVVKQEGGQIVKEVTTKSGTPTKTTSTTGKITPSTSSLKFADEDNLKQVIAELRRGDLNWILLSYEGGNGNTISLFGKGTGTADEMKENLNEKIVGYALIRVVEQIDETQAIKFCFIKYQGPQIPVMLKARLGTHSGDINKFLHPYHVTIDATDISEISDEIVRRTVGKASGTNSNVLNETVVGSKFRGNK